MSDQKNIDNLFREAFKDFEAKPDAALWDKISSQLDENSPKADKKKEGIVFLPWLYKIAGVAAALLLLFFIGNQFIDNSEEIIDPTNQTTSTTNNTTTNGNSSTNTSNTSGTSSDLQVTGNESTTEKQNLQNNNDSQHKTLEQKERIANEQNLNNSDTNNKNSVKKSVQKGSALQNAVATQENGTNSNTTSQQLLNNTNNGTNRSNRIKTNTTVSQEKAVANTSSNTNNISNNTSSVNNSNSTKNNTTISQKNAVAGTSSNISNNTTNKNSSTTKGVNKNGSTTQNTTNSKNNVYSDSVAEHTKNTSTSNTVKKGVNSSATAETKNTQQTVKTNAVAQQNTKNETKTANSGNDGTNTPSNTEKSATELDTTKEAIASTNENKKEDEIKKSLLDVINDLHALEKDSTAVAEANLKRWTISPNASPVYYNTLVNGSPISESFADNAKTGDVNLSFGVNVGYDVSKRLTIRTGVHKVDYSYSTQDVALVPTINTGPGAIIADGSSIGTNSINNITNIAYAQSASTFRLQDRQQVAINNEFVPTILESSIRQAQIEGNLNQRMSFIEVPIELKYAVIDKKIGVNVIGGVSTLLLTENSLLLESPALTTELGEATNINDLSFSTNIGIGIDYKLSNQLEFNLEPMLKYQLNTFSGNTGNFKPYSVGVYTGVSFRF
ncbi:hypothetical protein [uncultured Kordia sp.]|uniref:hypothetical protein n=1 Tax=uncultured Kordia sp. TaxID=507699 RepID=UPI002621207C|nr:hypothetical protein [uncultured Kordia sp.]